LQKLVQGNAPLLLIVIKVLLGQMRKKLRITRLETANKD
jgi:hypothetical protein